MGQTLFSTPPRALRADLEHRCLRGLGEVAAALAGEDPTVVCDTFTRWEQEARRPWPWLAGMCWAALEPLGLAFPDGDRHAVVAGRLLVGGETDPVAVLAAVESLRGRRPPSGVARAVGPDSQAIMRQQRLASAVDAFWSAYRRAARRLHEYVREGDRAGADDLVVSTRRRLEELAERVAGLAEASVPPAGTAGPPGGRPATGGLPATLVVDGEPTGPLVAPRAVAARPGRRPRRPPGRRPRATRAADGREYGRLHEHRYAPVVFLAAACLMALVWLVRVAAG